MLIDGALAGYRLRGRDLGLPVNNLIPMTGLRLGQLAFQLHDALLRELTFWIGDALLAVVLIHQQIIPRPLRSRFAGHLGGDLRSDVDGGRVVGGRASCEDVDDDVVANGHHTLSGPPTAVLGPGHPEAQASTWLWYGLPTCCLRYTDDPNADNGQLAVSWCGLYAR
jgi:hypothetical protein